jgi:glucuronate isomerase
MRANGVPERCCTGDAPDRDKFQAWAETVPRCLRSPLYHWTHLELDRPFGINDCRLGPDTAQGIWERCNDLLATPEFSVRGLLRGMAVKVVCTTDDPADGLEHHIAIAQDESFPVQVRPTWRPDRCLGVEDPPRFNAWLGRLVEVGGAEIRTLDELRESLRRRHEFFHRHGCRLSDHGLETMWAADYTEAQLRAIFLKVRSGTVPEAADQERWRSAMLYEGALMDHAAGWVQQFHLGPIRNLNARLFSAHGPDAGADSIGDAAYARPLARFLDRLDRERHLAKTILYNQHPKDNAVLATMAGNFQDGSVPGKIQFGAAWWFLDQRDGITDQLNILSAHGLLSRFVGMLTDSRSFLSFARHDYFRRILCQLLGDEIERGLLPNDLALVGGMVSDICYGNAVSYFDFGLAKS